MAAQFFTGSRNIYISDRKPSYQLVVRVNDTHQWGSSLTCKATHWNAWLHSPRLCPLLQVGDHIRFGNLESCSWEREKKVTVWSKGEAPYQNSVSPLSREQDVQDQLDGNKQHSGFHAISPRQCIICELIWVQKNYLSAYLLGKKPQSLSKFRNL